MDSREGADGHSVRGGPRGAPSGLWRRSLAYRLIVITTLAVGKMAWGVVDGRGTGWAMLVPGLARLVICDAGVLYATHRMRRRSQRRYAHPSANAAMGEADSAERAATLSGAGSPAVRHVIRRPAPTAGASEARAGQQQPHDKGDTGCERSEQQP